MEMKRVVVTTKFKKDIERISKRQKNKSKLDIILRELVLGKTLSQNLKPHKLKGNYEGLWECHIETDWLLIFDVSDEHITLIRTGTHSDLF